MMEMGCNGVVGSDLCDGLLRACSHQRSIPSLLASARTVNHDYTSARLQASNMKPVMNITTLLAPF